MADGVNNKYNLDALYKIVYPDGVENAIPDQTRLQALIKFNRKIGEAFKQPVILTLPGGVTYGGINDMTSGAGGAYDLGESIISDSVKLTCQGYQITLRECIGYGAAKSAKGGPESFKDAIGHVFDALALTGRRLIEWDLLQGQSGQGLGVVSAAGGSYTYTVTAASWAAGAYIGSKGHRICAYDRTTGEPNSTARGTWGTISSVNYATRTVTYTTELTGITADDVVFRANALASDGSTKAGQFTGSVWKSCLGVMKAASTTGTVWGIDNTSYELIRGETKSAGSTDLSFDTTAQAMGQLFTKGASGEFLMLVSPTTWANLISPEVAVRRHDASYNKAKVDVGSDQIQFHHITGVLKIEAHPMMRDGEALIFQPSLWERVGSTDLTFEQDVGAASKRIFLHMPNKNGFEIRAFSDQAPFSRRLGYTCVINNIVNS